MGKMGWFLSFCFPSLSVVLVQACELPWWGQGDNLRASMTSMTDPLCQKGERTLSPLLNLKRIWLQKTVATAIFSPPKRNKNHMGGEWARKFDEGKRLKGCVYFLDVRSCDNGTSTFIFEPHFTWGENCCDQIPGGFREGDAGDRSPPPRRSRDPGGPGLDPQPLQQRAGGRGAAIFVGGGGEEGLHLHFGGRAAEEKAWATDQPPASSGGLVPHKEGRPQPGTMPLPPRTAVYFFWCRPPPRKTLPQISRGQPRDQIPGEGGGYVPGPRTVDFGEPRWRLHPPGKNVRHISHAPAYTL